MIRADLRCGTIALHEFISDAAYPCVGAKAAIGQGTLAVFQAGDMTSAQDDRAIHRALTHAARRTAADLGNFRSFAVLFGGPVMASEAEFEDAMWDRLQALADWDAQLGFSYDERVDRDPVSPHFALSLGGKGYFAIGLHPRASRPARRFRYPAIVLNQHAQFEQLRDSGQYEKMRATILSRDLRLAGSVNPMLSRHGETSAARQYSGRAVDDSWRCPFRDPRA
ncbi:guanitoxin biosynthesis heme-dependent pre-guanitoxin N-hydroxylase GntA [Qipengyuania sp. ASV99]|uniref:guanitoxin biosynthesis heme-dependent pre-guanitoxin N-hydroxylase GntA n=1 Tax=Qipengyuania sp. ASV99 TaxID=3399681 RepID=UPI003A4C529C